jgi:YVTN family beta-propeller protein
MLVVLALAGCQDPEVIFPQAAAEWPNPVEVPPPTGERIYLTNNGDDTVSVVDAETFEEIDRAPVGLVPVEREGPHHLAVTPDGAWAFIGISNFAPGSGTGPHGSHGSGTEDGYCLKMSLADDRIVDSVRVEPNPGDVRLMPDGITVLQSHFDLLKMQEVADAGDPIEDGYARLFVIDGEKMDVIRRVTTCAAPHGIGTAADGSAVYLACWGSDEIAIVDMQTSGYEVTHVPVGPDPRYATPNYGPYALMVSPVDGSVWLSCWMSDLTPEAPGEVRRFDPQTGEMDTDLVSRQLGNPMFGTFSADGSRLYVPFQLSDILSVFDPTTGSQIDSVVLTDTKACVNVHAVDLSPDESALYVVCEGNHPVSGVGTTNGTLLELDPETLEMRRFVELGVYPDDIAVVAAP